MLPPEKLKNLVKKATEGDTSAASELIEAYQSKLYKYLFYLSGNEALAQDLCQDTFIKALDSLKSLKSPSGFGGWLKQIGKNLYIDFIKSPKNSGYQDINDQAFQVEASRTDFEQRDLVSMSLHQLETEDREVLILIDLEGVSYTEASEIIGVSEGALKSKIHRARKRFIEIYEKNETFKGVKSS